MPHKTLGVLFDLDGTLVDSAPDLAGAVNAMRVKRHLPPLPLAQLRPFASHGARGLLGAGFDMNDSHPDYFAMRDEFLEYYERHATEHTRLFEGVDEVLNHLEKNQIAWGIITNKYQRFTTPVVQSLGLDKRAQVIVCGDTTAHAKPHPEPLIYAAKQLNLPAQNLCGSGRYVEPVFDCVDTTENIVYGQGRIKYSGRFIRSLEGRLV